MTYTLDVTDAASLSTFVEAISSTVLSPDDVLVIEDMEEAGEEMVKVVTDEEGNVVRDAILGCFQFNGDDLSIFIGSRTIKGKTVRDGQRLTITVESDNGGA